MPEDKLDIELDAVLARLPETDPPVGLAERILADAPRPPRKTLIEGLRSAIFPSGRRWPAAGALASLSVGMMAGYAVAQDTSLPVDADSIVYAALGLDADRFELEYDG